jgi:hypothetical protein
MSRMKCDMSRSKAMQSSQGCALFNSSLQTVCSRDSKAAFGSNPKGRVWVAGSPHEAPDEDITDPKIVNIQDAQHVIAAVQG